MRALARCKDPSEVIPHLDISRVDNISLVAIMSPKAATQMSPNGLPEMFNFVKM